MDPNKLGFKSDKQPHYEWNNYEFYFYAMRLYDTVADSWYEFRIKDNELQIRLYPYGFFWSETAMTSSKIAELQGAYAEYVLLEEE